MRTRTIGGGVALILAALAGALVSTQSRYLSPPQSVIDIVDAPALPLVEVSPAGDVLAVLPRRDMPSIDEISQPMLRLAGLRINPANNGPHRAPSGTGIMLRTIATGSERPVQVPAGARIGAFSFSPDGKRFSFTNTRESRIDLYVGDVATGAGAAGRRRDERSRRRVRVARRQLGAALRLRAERDAVPRPAGRSPGGPNIQENYGKPGPVRTYQDLLTSAHDEDLFEYYLHEPARARRCGHRTSGRRSASRGWSSGTRVARRAVHPRRARQAAVLAPAAVVRLPAGRRGLESQGRERCARSPTCRWATGADQRRHHRAARVSLGARSSRRRSSGSKRSTRATSGTRCRTAIASSR